MSTASRPPIPWPAAVVLAAVAGLPTACAVAPTEPPRSPAEHELDLESFEMVWRIVRDEHPDPDLGGLDWQAVHDELRPGIEEASTLTEVRSVIGEMLARLEQSHFRISPRELYEADDETSDHPGSIGLDLRILDGRAIVTSVRARSPAETAGIRAGWEVAEVNGEDVASLLEPILARHEETPDLAYALVSTVLSRMGGSVGDAVTIELLDGDDRRVRAELVHEGRPGELIDLPPAPPHRVTFESRLLPDGVGYVTFSSFSGPAHLMGLFNEAMESFLDAPGIVIDLRGNPGGLGAMAGWMAGWLIEDDGVSLGTMIERDGELRFPVIPRARTYGGPVALLVDGLSASTAEVLASGLQDIGRACVVGSRTAGASGPASITALPNGDRFVHATAVHLTPNGALVEGIGVSPDVEVHPTREALLEGRDPALEAAVTWLLAQGGRQG